MGTIIKSTPIENWTFETFFREVLLTYTAQDLDSNKDAMLTNYVMRLWDSNFLLKDIPFLKNLNGWELKIAAGLVEQLGEMWKDKGRNEILPSWISEVPPVENSVTLIPNSYRPDVNESGYSKVLLKRNIVAVGGMFGFA
ncbi:hypothetical protein WDW89_26545 [Deltaproteobacteria bacterium TL4]